MTTQYFSSGVPIEVPANAIQNDSFTMGATGLTTSPTGTASYQRIANHVFLSLPAINGTSNSTSFTLTGLPVAITPSAARNIAAVQVTNAAAAIVGSATVNTNGTITLSAGLLGVVFSAVLGKAVAAQEISYLI